MKNNTEHFAIGRKEKRRAMRKLKKEIKKVGFVKFIGMLGQTEEAIKNEEKNN